MNICIVANNAYGALTGENSGHIGGVERQTALLSEWLAAKGHQVSVVTWDEGGASEEYINDIKIIKLCKKNDGLPLFRFFCPRWSSLNKALASADADVYYHNCIEYVTGQIAIWCKHHKKAFIYATASDTDCRPDLINQRSIRERYLFKYGLRCAKLLITQTQKQQSLLQRNFSLDSIVIPMPGTPPVNYDFAAAANDKFDQKKIIWVGRVCSIKRLEWFIEAANELPELEFDVIGPADLSCPTIKNLIDKVIQTRNMNYLGKINRSDMPDVYKNSAVLCCTSIIEGFPNTFLEAWSYQTPVVTSFDPDDIVKNKQLGLSVSNQAELVLALKKIMKDQQLRQRFAHNALAYFENNHSLENVMIKFEQAFKTQLEDNNTKRYFDLKSDQWADFYKKGELSTSHLDVQARLHITEEFIRSIKLSEYSNTLDLGCGTGEATTILKHTQQYAVDFSEKMINQVKKKYPHVHSSVANATHLPFESKKFELVIALGVFEYIKNFPKAIQEVHRVLSPDGCLIMSFPNKTSAFRKIRRIEEYITKPFKYFISLLSPTKLPEKPFHQQWNEPFFQKTLHENGFEIETIKYCSYGFLSPKLSTTNFNLKLSKWLTQLIKPNSWLERQLAHTAVILIKNKSNKKKIKLEYKMLKLAKHYIKSAPNLHLIFMHIKNALIKLQCLWVTDKIFIEKSYKKIHKQNLNLESPQTFNEKLQWLKLYYRKDLMRQCADKYEVRGYVKNILGNEVLNTLYGTYESIDDICFDSLPERFVIKVTHGSGQNLIVNNKSKVNWDYESNLLKFYMKSNHYFEGREWVYKDIKPRVICEAYLDENGKPPIDYKFFCFNGEPKFIQLDLDRFEVHRRNMYDLNWNLLPFEYEYSNYDKQVKRPEGLEKMVDYARQLAQEFPYIRVDFYYVNGHIYFGELTFHPEQGLGIFSPKKYDLEFGQLLKLPERLSEND